MLKRVMEEDFWVNNIKDIAEQIKQHNIEVDKRKITLDEPIRVLGSRFVDIKIHQK